MYLQHMIYIILILSELNGEVRLGARTPRGRQ